MSGAFCSTEMLQQLTYMCSGSPCLCRYALQVNGASSRCGLAWMLVHLLLIQQLQWGICCLYSSCNEVLTFARGSQLSYHEE